MRTEKEIREKFEDIKNYMRMNGSGLRMSTGNVLSLFENFEEWLFKDPTVNEFPKKVDDDDGTRDG